MASKASGPKVPLGVFRYPEYSMSLSDALPRRRNDRIISERFGLVRSLARSTTRRAYIFRILMILSSMILLKKYSPWLCAATQQTFAPTISGGLRRYQGQHL
jgi:hypothetical protein